MVQEQMVIQEPERMEVVLSDELEAPGVCPSRGCRPLPLMPHDLWGRSDRSCGSLTCGLF